MATKIGDAIINAMTEDRMIVSYKTPTLNERCIEEYIVGYVDGEGCFSVSFSKRPKILVGWETKPSFAVSQNHYRPEVLYLIQQTLRCGNFRRDFSDQTLKFEVRKLDDLLNKVIPFFERYPLISGKQKDFELFKEVCSRIGKQEHLAKNSFKQILNLAFRMNVGGRRRYSIDTILASLGSEEDIVCAIGNNGQQHEVQTRTNGVTSGVLSREIAR